MAGSPAVAAPRQGLQPLLPEGAEPVARACGPGVEDCRMKPEVRSQTGQLIDEVVLKGE